MFIRAIALSFFLAPVVLAQQPGLAVPDPKLTSGDAFEVTVQDLCIPGFAKKDRDVPAEIKREVYNEYGITSHGSRDYEVDHQIPPELGSPNSIKNLWPESHRSSRWNAQVKERFEGNFMKSAFLALVLASATLGQETVVHGRVIAVTDGDTLKVLVGEQKLLRIRLAFCQAPEKKQAFGARAKQAVSELVLGKDIELRTHAIEQYELTVAQVLADGKDVGTEMLRQGLAWVDDRDITDASSEIQDTYRKSQEEAKADQRGLWSDPDSIPPWIL
jgi:endonuclease YncB( thermonuclease family)